MQVSFNIVNQNKKTVSVDCGTKTCTLKLKKKRAFTVLCKLLELYPKPLDIHKHLKQYHDPNRAYNDLKNDEGYEPYLVESRNKKHTMTVKLQIEKLCKYLIAQNGDAIYLGVEDQRESLSPELQKKIVDQSSKLCNITNIPLSDKSEFDSKTFAKSLMVVNFDHRRPKFKGGGRARELSDNLRIYQ